LSQHAEVEVTAKAMDDETVRPGCKSLFNSMAEKAD